MFDISACHVERKRDHNYLVRWRTSTPGQRVAVYMSDNPDGYYGGSDLGTPVLTTTGPEALLQNPDKRVRHYFYLESERGEAVVLAERQLALEGAPNFRDLGGYEARDGRRLKWGKLYRSSKLSRLTEPDINYVRRLGLTLICDFRQVLEQELEPTVLGDGHSALLASLPIAPGSSHSFLENLHKGIIAVENASVVQGGDQSGLLR